MSVDCVCLAETEQGIFEQVLRGDIDFMSDPWPTISESAKDLIRKMLHPNPAKRLKAHQVLSKSDESITEASYNKLWLPGGR